MKLAKSTILHILGADSMLIDKAWSRVKVPDGTLGGKAAAFFVKNIMKAKKKFRMGLNETENKAREKIMKNRMKKTNPSNVINVASKTLKTRKNDIVEYLDYQIPDTQLKGPK